MKALLSVLGNPEADFRAIYPCIDGREEGFPPGRKVDVVIRPEDIDIVPYGEGLWNGTQRRKSCAS